MSSEQILIAEDLYFDLGACMVMLKVLNLGLCIFLLIQVMLQVAPDALYMELFERFFQHQLLQLAVHPSANFVIQALIAAARNVDQVCSFPTSFSA